MHLYYVQWTCPNSKCNFKNTDSIDDELGPFWSLVCSECGVTVDMKDVAITRREDIEK